MPFTTDGKGKPIDDPDSQHWYHGSPLSLDVLATGSSVTRSRELAIAFSHKPSQLGVADDGTISHNGKQNGYLYEVAEALAPDDLRPHGACVEHSPNDLWEWVTKRPLRLRLIQRTFP